MAAALMLGNGLQAYVIDLWRLHLPRPCAWLTIYRSIQVISHSVNPLHGVNHKDVESVTQICADNKLCTLQAKVRHVDTSIDNSTGYLEKIIACKVSECEIANKISIWIGKPKWRLGRSRLSEVWPKINADYRLNALYIIRQTPNYTLMSHGNYDC
jgi:hypothetical protein